MLVKPTTSFLFIWTEQEATSRQIEPQRSSPTNEAGFTLALGHLVELRNKENESAPGFRYNLRQP